MTWEEMQCFATSFTHEELFAEGEELSKEASWIIEDIFPIGCNILAGGPKMGKSILALNIAIDVAYGLDAFGIADSGTGEHRSVLYAALEDTKKRLYERSKEFDRTLRPGNNLTFTIRLARAGEGGLDYLRGWVRNEREDGRNPTLIIIDTLQKFRDMYLPGNGIYASDYAAVECLQDLAKELGVTILIIHHTRKAASEDGDYVKEINGTQGLTGAADNMFVLKRARRATSAVLSASGRDVVEGDMLFDKDGLHWVFKGYASEDDSYVSEAAQEVLDWFKEYGGEHTPAEVAAGLDKNSERERTALRKLMKRMATRGKLDSWGGYYFLPR
jgi:hypothetical protein